MIRPVDKLDSSLLSIIRLIMKHFKICSLKSKNSFTCLLIKNCQFPQKNGTQLINMFIVDIFLQMYMENKGWISRICKWSKFQKNIQGYTSMRSIYFPNAYQKNGMKQFKTISQKYMILQSPWQKQSFMLMENRLNGNSLKKVSIAPFIFQH